MAEGRRGLGRGLSALMGEANAAGGHDGRRAGHVQEIPTELVRRNPDQPRRRFDDEDMAELTASVRERGVLQPILVRPLEGGDYQIVAGERRWRAAQAAGLDAVPAVVREADDGEIMELALIENIQRVDIAPLEEARCYVDMIERFGRRQADIAAAVGKSRSHVANTARLMRLPERVREHLEAGRLTAGHARALLDVEDCERVAEQVVRKGLNVRQTEALAKRARDGGGRPARPAAKRNADTAALENDLGEVLGLKVAIRDQGGAGEVKIAYRTLEQLDDLCARLMRPARARG